MESILNLFLNMLHLKLVCMEVLIVPVAFTGCCTLIDLVTKVTRHPRLTDACICTNLMMLRRGVYTRGNHFI